MQASGLPVCRIMWISGRTCVALLRVNPLLNKSRGLNRWYCKLEYSFDLPVLSGYRKAGRLEIVQIDDYSGRLQNQDLA
jgi:hypothetical protein